MNAMKLIKCTIVILGCLLTRTYGMTTPTPLDSLFGVGSGTGTGGTGVLDNFAMSLFRDAAAGGAADPTSTNSLGATSAPSTSVGVTSSPSIPSSGTSSSSSGAGAFDLSSIFTSGFNFGTDPSAPTSTGVDPLASLSTGVTPSSVSGPASGTSGSVADPYNLLGGSSSTGLGSVFDSVLGGSTSGGAAPSPTVPTSSGNILSGGSSTAGGSAGSNSISGMIDNVLGRGGKGPTRAAKPKLDPMSMIMMMNLVSGGEMGEGMEQIIPFLMFSQMSKSAGAGGNVGAGPGSGVGAGASTGSILQGNPYNAFSMGPGPSTAGAAGTGTGGLNFDALLGGMTGMTGGPLG